MFMPDSPGQSSGAPLLLQSALVPSVMSQTSSRSLPLQSAMNVIKQLLLTQVSVPVQKSASSQCASLQHSVQKLEQQ